MRTQLPWHVESESPELMRQHAERDNKRQSSSPRTNLSIFGRAGKTYDPCLLFATIVNRHVAAFSRVVTIGSQLAHKVFESESSLLKHARLSILTRDNITWT